MRVFLDTNVLASALVTRGLCADLFEAVLGEHDLLTCQLVLDELARILTTKFRMPADLARAYIQLIEDSAERITETMAITATIPDPNDVSIVAAARAGQAACFITGDKALLEVGEVDTMPILSPRQFWERFHLART